MRAYRVPSAVALTAAVGLLAGACSTSHSEGKSPEAKKPTSKPTSSATSAQDAAKTEVLDAYGQYWSATQAAFAKASTNGLHVDKHASGKALAEVEGTVKGLHKNNVVFHGKPTRLHTEVVDVTGKTKGKVPSAQLRECIDVSKWLPVNRKTGKPEPLPKERRKKYVETAKVEKWGKAWKVLTVNQLDRAC